MLDFFSYHCNSRRAYSGPGGIADVPGIDVSARATLGLFFKERVSIVRGKAKDGGGKMGILTFWRPGVAPGPPVQAEQPAARLEPC